MLTRRHLNEDRGALEPFLPFFLFSLTFLFLTLPDFLVLFSVPEGMVWSPVNSFKNSLGDAYYYAAWVREAYESPFFPVNPTSSELSSTYSVESFKTVPFVLGSLPAYLFDDFRYALLVSYGLFPSLIVISIYSFARRWGGGLWVSALVSVLSVFLYETPSDLLNFSNYLEKRWDIISLDWITTQFRFVNTSISSLVFLAFVFLIFEFLKAEKVSPVHFSASLILGAALAFTYLPQAFVGFLLVFSLFCVCLIFRRTSFKVYLYLGISLLLFLLLIDYLHLYTEFSSNTKFVDQVFSASPSSVSRKAIDMELAFTSMLSGGYTRYYLINAGMLVASLLLANRAYLRVALCSVLLTLLLVVAFCAIADSQNLLSRFIIRGLQPVISVLSFLSLLSRLEHFLCDRHWVKFLRYFCIFLLATLVSFSLAGSYRLGDRFANDTSRLISMAEWDTYQWVDNNLPKNADVLAVSWSDVYMLPIYSDSNLFYGHWILDNREAIEEIERYIATWKMLGRSRGDFSKLVDNSLDNFHLVKSGVMRKQAAPYATDTISESALFSFGLIYYPFVKQFNGQGLINSDGKLSDDFKFEIMSIYDELDYKALIASSNLDYILLPTQHEKALLNSFIGERLEKLFENDERIVYKIN